PCQAPDPCGGWKPCLLMDASGKEPRQDRLVREWAGSVAMYGPDPVTLGVMNGTGSGGEHFENRLAAAGSGCQWLHYGRLHEPAVADRIIVTQELDPLSKGVICVERFNGEAFKALQYETLALLMDATADWQR